MQKQFLLLPLFAVSIWLGSLPILYAEEASSVTGEVRDLQGKSVAEAVVTAIPRDRLAIGIMPEVRADGEGKFRFMNLRPGQYQLAAKKEEDFYADPTVTFYPPKFPMPAVALKSGQRLEGITITIGPRGGRVRVTTVDAKTGSRILQATIGFYHADSSQDYMGTTSDRNGTFNLLVPSTMPFRMRVSALGYETANCGPNGTTEHALPIEVSSGSTKEFVISLRPLKKGSR